MQKQPKTTVKKHSIDNGIEKVISKAGRITNFTLQTLVNHSGVPYQHTVPRKFVEEQLSIFMQQPYTATLFTAPAGYGKTIGLCHWVNDMIKANTVKDNRDIILFLSGNTLSLSLQNIHLTEWLMGLIGASLDDEIGGLADLDEKFKGRFLLIIDGFDEFWFKNNSFEATFNQLTDIINLYSKHKWFKVILTMRSATWNGLKHDILGKPDIWFTGFMMDRDQKLNVPLLTSEQLMKLSDNINPAAPRDIKVSIINKLSYPLYFQFYYQRYSDDFSFNHFNELTYYHLVAANFYHNVYKGYGAIEKVLILTGIINQMDTDNKIYEVNKLKVYELIKKYSSAYQELISSGILEELNLSSENKINIIIRLSDEASLEYALAMILMYNNNYVFDENLVSLANILFDKQKKLPIIKWFIYNAIHNDYKFDLNALMNVQFQPNEKSEIITFIGQLLKIEHVSLKMSERMEDLFRQVCSEDFFNYFISLEFIDIGYEQVLETFLQFGLSAQQKILIKTCLAAIAVMQLDLIKLEKHLNDLKQLNLKSISNLPINPVNCIETILFYLKYGIVKKDALAEITKFYFNPTHPAAQSKGFTEVVNLLALYTSTICQKHNKAGRLVHAFNKVCTAGHSVSYLFISKIILAESCLTSGRQDKAFKIFNELNSHYSEQEAGFTTFMKVLYQGLKIKLTLPGGNHQLVINNIKNLIKLCDESKQIFVKVNTLAFILTNYAVLKENVYVFNDLYFDFIKSIRTNGCRTEQFMNEEIKWVENKDDKFALRAFNSFGLNDN